MYQDKFTTGQTIRSYDFESRRDCYVEGEIVALHTDCKAVPFYAYELKVTKVVWDGQVDGRPADYDEAVFAPMVTTFDYEGRLELVEPEQDDTPAAACPKCGGWTAHGGMSQHHRTDRMVEGRMGCTCDADVEYGKRAEAAYKAKASVEETIEWMLEKIDRTQNQLDMTRNSMRGQNTLVIMEQESGIGFMRKTDGGYNFAGAAYNAPRFSPEDAEKIADELNAGNDREGVTFGTMFDRDAMQREIDDMKNNVQWTRNEVLGYAING